LRHHRQEGNLLIQHRDDGARRAVHRLGRGRRAAGRPTSTESRLGFTELDRTFSKISF
jgi:hypothetical protein